MRLLRLKDNGEFDLAEYIGRQTPQYAILSHTWRADHEEVTFKDVMDGCLDKSKAGYRKLIFCAKQAMHDGLEFCWVDTCCINKSSSAELSEAINSMFRWYHDAAKCYVYLSDVSTGSEHLSVISTGGAYLSDTSIGGSLGKNLHSQRTWDSAFQRSRWFTRGWTLQELLAPRSVEFFSANSEQLGDKTSLLQEIHNITGIPTQGLQQTPLSQFSVDERMLWAKRRETKREEDAAYSLLGIFNIHIPLLYGEGREKALNRLRREIRESSRDESLGLPVPLATEEPRPSRQPFPNTSMGKNNKFTDHSTTLVARLHRSISQQRDHIAAQLASLPQHSRLLSSVTHTFAYVDWVRSGGVLWCSTQGSSWSSISSTIAAMITQYLAISRKDIYDTDKVFLYHEIHLLAKNKANDTKSQNESRMYPHTHHWLRTLILQSFFSSKNKLADLQSTIRKLPDDDRRTLANVIDDPESETTDRLKDLLDCLIGLRNGPLIIAIDKAHVLAKKDFDGEFFKTLINLPKRMHGTRKVQIILGGYPEATLVQALSGARFVDSDTEYQECLESLCFAGQHTRLEQIGIADQSTSDWIWTHPSYVAWKGGGSGILWIEGKPGSGKSVLAKGIQKEMSDDHKTYTCHWFFSTRGGHILTAHTYFLRSILYQLLQQNQTLFQHFQETYREQAPLVDLSWESLQAMQRILRSIIATGLEIQCVIDAMDEAETGDDDGQERRMLLVTISQLVGIIEQSHLKIILFSRPFLDIDVEFGYHQRLFGNLHKIVLQEENSGTVRTVVDTGIESLRNAMRYWTDGDKLSRNSDRKAPPEPTLLSRAGVSKPKQVVSFQEKQQIREDAMLEKLKSYLLANAQGVVLWVTLILSILHSTIRKGMYTFPELEKKWNSLPLQLDDLYRHIVDDIKRNFEAEDLVKVRRALMFVSGWNTLKPLKLEELRESLAIPQDFESALRSDVDPVEESRAHIASWKEFRWQLNAMCGQLVEVISTKKGPTPLVYGVEDVNATDTIQLLHRTVKDFLASSDLAGPLSFSEEDAALLIQDSLRIYTKIVLPPAPTKYANLATSKDSNWAQTIEIAAAYLSDKTLLPWIFNDLPNDPLKKRKTLGIFFSLLQDSAFPSLADWTELELKREFGLHVDASSGLESAKAIISAHFVDYACSNGLTIAVRTLLEILSLDQSCHIASAVFDAALLVAIKYEMLDLMQPLIRFSVTEPECRFWEEAEYKLRGMSYYLTSFEMIAAQTGNEAVVTAVYDRNHQVSKMMPWGKWWFLSRGRMCWSRSRDDWNAFLDLTRDFKRSRQALKPLSLESIREAIQLIIDYRML